MDLNRYRKAAVAIAAAVVEIVAVWQGAPEWALTAAALAGVVLVYAVPNRPGAVLPHLSSVELLEMAQAVSEREERERRP